MEHILQFIQNYQNFAPWVIFFLILLAGLNIPISLDGLVIISAILAAKALPEKTFTLYFCVLFGAIFSAWISYWLGRKLGAKLLNISFFNKLMPEKRLSRVKEFYEKHGFITLLIGRFIPFGVRNCIFFTTGLSHFNFKKFAIRDSISCSIWCTISFYLFYTLGINYHALSYYLRRIHIFVFLGLSVTLITFFWYKQKKRKKIS